VVDFFLCGTAAALIFNKLFFPTFDPTVGTLLAFATYALGFVARPLGGLVFGHYGDRIGRKTMLYLTLLIMGAATTVTKPSRCRPSAHFRTVSGGDRVYFRRCFLSRDVVPDVHAARTKNPQLAGIAIVLGLAVNHAAMCGPQASFFSELFGTKVRYSGVSLGYNLASIFAGALSPLIAVGLMTAYKPETWPISVYMIALALITIVSVYFAKETRRNP